LIEVGLGHIFQNILSLNSLNHDSSEIFKKGLCPQGQFLLGSHIQPSRKEDGNIFWIVDLNRFKPLLEIFEFFLDRIDETFDVIRSKFAFFPEEAFVAITISFFKIAVALHAAGLVIDHTRFPLKLARLSEEGIIAITDSGVRIAGSIVFTIGIIGADERFIFTLFSCKSRRAFTVTKNIAGSISTGGRRIRFIVAIELRSLTIASLPPLQALATTVTGLAKTLLFSATRVFGTQ
jgi:hypothetical protein